MRNLIPIYDEKLFSPSKIYFFDGTRYRFVGKDAKERNILEPLAGQRISASLHLSCRQLRNIFEVEGLQSSPACKGIQLNFFHQP